jgi:hypothetical protein
MKRGPRGAPAAFVAVVNVRVAADIADQLAQNVSIAARQHRRKPKASSSGA